MTQLVQLEVTDGVARIKLGLADHLSLGNLDARRDWGFAGDYVRAMWLMLQQEVPEDFVIATGQQRSVREFVEMSAARLGITLTWSGEGVDEIGTVTAVDAAISPSVKVGDVIVRVDPRYFRPTEVETLLGDPTNAKQKLGWEPETTLEQMVDEMVAGDLKTARKEAYLATNFK